MAFREYYAIGSGASYALGVLHALYATERDAGGARASRLRGRHRVRRVLRRRHRRAPHHADASLSLTATVGNAGGGGGRPRGPYGGVARVPRPERAGAIWRGRAPHRDHAYPEGGRERPSTARPHRRASKNDTALCSCEALVSIDGVARPSGRRDSRSSDARRCRASQLRARR